MKRVMKRVKRMKRVKELKGGCQLYSGVSWAVTRLCCGIGSKGFMEEEAGGQLHLIMGNELSSLGKE